MKSQIKPSKLEALKQALSIKAINFALPPVEIIFSGKTDKNALIGIRHLTTIAQCLNETPFTDVNQGTIEALLHLINRYIAWIIHDGQKMLGEESIKPLKGLINTTRKLLKFKGEQHYTAELFHLDWCLNQPLSLSHKKDGWFRFEAYLLNHFNLFLYESKNAPRQEFAEEFINFLGLLTLNVPIKNLELEHLTQLSIILGYYLDWYYKESDCPQSLLRICETVHVPYILICNQVLENLSPGQKKMQIQKVPLESRLRFWPINTNFLLARNFLLIHKQATESWHYFREMEHSIAPLMDVFNKKTRTLYDNEIDSVERYLTHRTLLLITTTNSIVNKDTIDSLNDDIGYLYKEYKHLNKWNIGLKCFQSYHNVLEYYLDNNHLTEAVSQLTLTENCLKSFKKLLKSDGFNKQFPNTSDQPEMKNLIKSSEEDCASCRERLSAILHKQYLSHLKDKTPFSVRVVDLDTLILKPGPCQMSFFKNNAAAIFKLLKQSGLNVHKTFYPNQFILIEVTSYSPDAFNKAVDYLVKNISLLRNKKALTEIRSRVRLFSSDRMSLYNFDIQPDVPAEVTKHLEESIVVEPELLEESLPIEATEPAPLVPEEEPLESFEMTRNGQSKAVYHVSLSATAKDNLNEHELNKVVAILATRKIGTDRPFGHGIFFFEPKTSDKKIRQQLTTEEMKLPCLKVKPSREDVRVIGVVREVKGVRTVELDKVVRNAH